MELEERPFTRGFISLGEYGVDESYDLVQSLISFFLGYCAIVQQFFNLSNYKSELCLMLFLD